MQRILLAPITTNSGEAALTGRTDQHIDAGTLVAITLGDDGRRYLVTRDDGEVKAIDAGRLPPLPGVGPVTQVAPMHRPKGP